MKTAQLNHVHLQISETCSGHFDTGPKNKALLSTLKKKVSAISIWTFCFFPRSFLQRTLKSKHYTGTLPFLFLAVGVARRPSTDMVGRVVGCS